jgi:hypothetical protein
MSDFTAAHNAAFEYFSVQDNADADSDALIKRHLVLLKQSQCFFRYFIYDLRSCLFFGRYI